jgi:hypothetical protein
MRTHALVNLPAEISSALLEDGTARAHRTTRGLGLPEVYTLTVEGIKTAAVVVSLAVNAEACRKLAIATIGRLRSTGPTTVTITIETGKTSRSITVDPSLPSAVDYAFEFFLSAFK